MMKRTIERIEIDMGELEKLLERARQGPLSEEDYQTLRAAMETLGYLTHLVGDKDTTIRKLRQIIFGSSTEKTRAVLGGDEVKVRSGNPEVPDAGSSSPEGNRESSGSPEEKSKGHGRNGASDFAGAVKVKVGHRTIQRGQRCPGCQKGKVYPLKEPARLVRITGQAPIQATVYELERFRCNLCGEVFTAEAPEGVGQAKYDEGSASMIALLKYGTGIPFYRLEQLQESMGMPLPASTQWEIVRGAAEAIEPAWQELIRQAAQGEVIHNDDTTIKILEMIRERRRRAEGSGNAGDSPERTGMFTSGIVSIGQGRKIALFFTGHQHAGENLKQVLQHRASELSAPIHMCDGLSRNVPDLPEEFEIILANCNAHARPNFVDVAPRFPEECRYVLETLREVYKNDAVARLQGMSHEERLAFHKAKSGPLMEDLRRWLAEQIDEKKVEPNSALGDAIFYMRTRWERLTRFLQVPGVPLDNNVCERALKKAILHRKNAYFYKTAKGAHVGDVFMSLIYTCQLLNVNPFDYLTELQKNAKDLGSYPEKWLPWTYQEEIEQGGLSLPASA